MCSYSWLASVFLKEWPDPELFVCIETQVNPCLPRRSVFLLPCIRLVNPYAAEVVALVAEAGFEFAGCLALVSSSGFS